MLSIPSLETALAGLLSPEEIATLVQEVQSLEAAPNPAESCKGTFGRRPAAPPVVEAPEGPHCAPQVLQAGERAASATEGLRKIQETVSGALDAAARSAPVAEACSTGLLQDLDALLAPIQAESAWAAQASLSAGPDFSALVYAFCTLGLLAVQAGQLERLAPLPAPGFAQEVRQRVPPALAALLRAPELAQLPPDDPLRLWFRDFATQELPAFLSSTRTIPAAFPPRTPAVEAGKQLEALTNRGYAYDLAGLQAFSGPLTWGRIVLGPTAEVPDQGALGDYFGAAGRAPAEGEEAGAYDASRRAAEKAGLIQLRARVREIALQAGAALLPLAPVARGGAAGFTVELTECLDRLQALGAKALRLRVTTAQDPAQAAVRLGAQLSQLKLCGQSLDPARLGQLGDGSGGLAGLQGAGGGRPAPESDEHRTFEGKDEPNPCEIRYWRKYAQVLNLMALLPLHWSIGLILPTPAGPLRVPLPVIWIPLVVIPAPAVLTVVWLTINGIVIVPTVWQLRMPPVAQSDSYHATLFRGVNTLIKAGTGSKVLSPPIVNLQDTNPALTKTLPYASDDLPVIQRVTPRNLLLLNYCRQWCSAARPFMGLP